MGLFSSSKKSTKQIDERRIATQYGNGIIAQDGSRVTTLATDHQAIGRALGFADESLDTVEEVTRGSVQAVDRAGGRILEAAGGALQFGGDAVDAIEEVSRGAIEAGDRDAERVLEATGRAIEASDRDADRVLQAAGGALEFAGNVRRLSAEESAAARRDALEFGDQALDSTLAVFRETSGDAFDLVDQSTTDVLEASGQQFDRALESVDAAGTRADSLVGAVLEDLQRSREVSAQQLASTEQALSAQSQRVTDIAATRLTGGVTDVVKYLSIAAAIAAVGFGIATRA